MRFFARPEGQRQLLESGLVVWDDLLPEYPADLARADAGRVADALMTSYGGSRGPRGRVRGRMVEQRRLPAAPQSG